MRLAPRRGQGGERRGRPRDTKRLGTAREHECGRVQLMRTVRIARALRSPRIVHWARDLERILDLRVIAPHFAPVEGPVRTVAKKAARLEPLGTKAQRHHREVNSASAHRLAAVVVAKLKRVLAVADALVGPVELVLMRLVGSEFFERTPPRARIERDHLEALFSETARKRAAARAGADDREVDGFILRILPHRRPGAHAKDVRRASVLAARIDAEHHRACWFSARVLLLVRRARFRRLPTDRAGRSTCRT